MKKSSHSIFKVFVIAIILIDFSLIANAQTITKNTSSSVSGTVCPIGITEYSVSFPNEFQSCSRLWTATNGTVDGNATGTTVKIKWDDTPGATGTVTITFSNCINDENNISRSKSELILSIKNQSWGSYTSSYNLDYCTTPYVDIFMPPMNVIGTGGVASHHV